MPCGVAKHITFEHGWRYDSCAEVGSTAHDDFASWLHATVELCTATRAAAKEDLDVL